MSASMEGNPLSAEWLSRGGKPIACAFAPPAPLNDGTPKVNAYDVAWSYEIAAVRGELASLTLTRNKRPYWSFRPSGKDGASRVRSAMSALFDLLAGMCEELRKEELVDVLSVVSSITFDLSGLVSYDT